MTTNIDPSTFNPTDLRNRVRHVVVWLALMGLSFLFYGRALDNPYWHAEDFNLIGTAQQLNEDPSGLLRDVTGRHHPVPLALVLLEYKIFRLDPTGYYAVNLFLHGLNAFLVYWLVAALLPDRRIAVLSGVLFVLGVGSYGKAVLFVAGVENLLITSLFLMILNLYVRNDIWQAGRLLTWRYLLVLFLFLVASFAKPTAFSLVFGLLAYKVFFRGERGSGRALLEPNFVILVAGALVFWVIRQATGIIEFQTILAGKNPFDFAVNFVKNMVNYLVHMFFPIHVSQLVTSNPVVRAIYAAAPVIRFLAALSIISYGLFGFVFGNRTIRFFLSWTLISVLPYCAITFPSDWLNIRYLYQVAVGFTFILASGTVLSMDLLHRRRWRRFIPFVVPLLFVMLSAYITGELDHKYEREGQSVTNQQNLSKLQEAERHARGQ